MIADESRLPITLSALLNTYFKKPLEISNEETLEGRKSVFQGFLQEIYSLRA